MSFQSFDSSSNPILSTSRSFGSGNNSFGNQQVPSYGRSATLRPSSLLSSQLPVTSQLSDLIQNVFSSDPGLRVAHSRHLYSVCMRSHPSEVLSVVLPLLSPLTHDNNLTVRLTLVNQLFPLCLLLFTWPTFAFNPVASTSPSSITSAQIITSHISERTSSVVSQSSRAFGSNSPLVQPNAAGNGAAIHPISEDHLPATANNRTLSTSNIADSSSQSNSPQFRSSSNPPSPRSTQGDLSSLRQSRPNRLSSASSVSSTSSSTTAPVSSAPAPVPSPTASQGLSSMGGVFERMFGRSKKSSTSSSHSVPPPASSVPAQSSTNTASAALSASTPQLKPQQPNAATSLNRASSSAAPSQQQQQQQHQQQQSLTPQQQQQHQQQLSLLQQQSSNLSSAASYNAHMNATSNSISHSGDFITSAVENMSPHLKSLFFSSSRGSVPEMLTRADFDPNVGPGLSTGGVDHDASRNPGTPAVAQVSGLDAIITYVLPLYLHLLSDPQRAVRESSITSLISLVSYQTHYRTLLLQHQQNILSQYALLLPRLSSSAFASTSSNNGITTTFNASSSVPPAPPSTSSANSSSLLSTIPYDLTLSSLTLLTQQFRAARYIQQKHQSIRDIIFSIALRLAHGEVQTQPLAPPKCVPTIEASAQLLSPLSTLNLSGTGSTPGSATPATSSTAKPTTQGGTGAPGAAANGAAATSSPAVTTRQNPAAPHPMNAGQMAIQQRQQQALTNQRAAGLSLLSLLSPYVPLPFVSNVVASEVYSFSDDPDVTMRMFALSQFPLIAAYAGSHVTLSRLVPLYLRFLSDRTWKIKTMAIAYSPGLLRSVDALTAYRSVLPLIGRNMADVVAPKWLRVETLKIIPQLTSVIPLITSGMLYKYIVTASSESDIELVASLAAGISAMVASCISHPLVTLLNNERLRIIHGGRQRVIHCLSTYSPQGFANATSGSSSAHNSGLNSPHRVSVNGTGPDHSTSQQQPNPNMVLLARHDFPDPQHVFEEDDPLFILERHSAIVNYPDFNVVFADHVEATKLEIKASQQLFLAQQKKLLAPVLQYQLQHAPSAGANVHGNPAVFDSEEGGGSPVDWHNNGIPTFQRTGSPIPSSSGQFQAFGADTSPQVSNQVIFHSAVTPQEQTVQLNALHMTVRPATSLPGGDIQDDLDIVREAQMMNHSYLPELPLLPSSTLLTDTASTSSLHSPFITSGVPPDYDAMNAHHQHEIMGGGGGLPPLLPRTMTPSGHTRHSRLVDVDEAAMLDSIAISRVEDSTDPRKFITLTDGYWVLPLNTHANNFITPTTIYHLSWNLSKTYLKSIWVPIVTNHLLDTSRYLRPPAMTNAGQQHHQSYTSQLQQQQQQQQQQVATSLNELNQSLASALPSLTALLPPPLHQSMLSHAITSLSQQAVSLRRLVTKFGLLLATLPIPLRFLMVTTGSLTSLKMVIPAHLIYITGTTERNQPLYAARQQACNSPQSPYPSLLPFPSANTAWLVETPRCNLQPQRWYGGNTANAANGTLGGDQAGAGAGNNGAFGAQNANGTNGPAASAVKDKEHGCFVSCENIAPSSFCTGPLAEVMKMYQQYRSPWEPNAGVWYGPTKPDVYAPNFPHVEEKFQSFQDWIQPNENDDLHLTGQPGVAHSSSTSADVASASSQPKMHVNFYDPNVSIFYDPTHPDYIIDTDLYMRRCAVENQAIGFPDGSASADAAAAAANAESEADIRHAQTLKVRQTLANFQVPISPNDSTVMNTTLPRHAVGQTSRPGGHNNVDNLVHTNQAHLDYLFPSSSAHFPPPVNSRHVPSLLPHPNQHSRISTYGVSVLFPLFSSLLPLHLGAIMHALAEDYPSLFSLLGGWRTRMALIKQLPLLLPALLAADQWQDVTARELIDEFAMSGEWYPHRLVWHEPDMISYQHQVSRLERQYYRQQRHAATGAAVTGSGGGGGGGAPTYSMTDLMSQPAYAGDDTALLTTFNSRHHQHHYHQQRHAGAFVAPSAAAAAAAAAAATSSGGRPAMDASLFPPFVPPTPPKGYYSLEPLPNLFPSNTTIDSSQIILHNNRLLSDLKQRRARRAVSSSFQSSGNAANNHSNPQNAGYHSDDALTSNSDNLTNNFNSLLMNEMLPPVQDVSPPVVKSPSGTASSLSKLSAVPSDITPHMTLPSSQGTRYSPHTPNRPLSSSIEDSLSSSHKTSSNAPNSSSSNPSHADIAQLKTSAAVGSAPSRPLKLEAFTRKGNSVSNKQLVHPHGSSSLALSQDDAVSLTADDDAAAAISSDQAEDASLGIYDGLIIPSNPYLRFDAPPSCLSLLTMHLLSSASSAFSYKLRLITYQLLPLLLSSAAVQAKKHCRCDSIRAGATDLINSDAVKFNNTSFSCQYKSSLPCTCLTYTYSSYFPLNKRQYQKIQEDQGRATSFEYKAKISASSPREMIDAAATTTSETASTRKRSSQQGGNASTAKQIDGDVEQHDASLRNFACDDVTQTHTTPGAVPNGVSNQNSGLPPQQEGFLIDTRFLPQHQISWIIILSLLIPLLPPHYWGQHVCTECDISASNTNYIPIFSTNEQHEHYLMLKRLSKCVLPENYPSSLTPIAGVTTQYPHGASLDAIQHAIANGEQSPELWMDLLQLDQTTPQHNPVKVRHIPIISLIQSNIHYKPSPHGKLLFLECAANAVTTLDTLTYSWLFLRPLPWLLRDEVPSIRCKALTVLKSIVTHIDSAQTEYNLCRFNKHQETLQRQHVLDKVNAATAAATAAAASRAAPQSQASAIGIAEMSRRASATVVSPNAQSNEAKTAAAAAAATRIATTAPHPTSLDQWDQHPRSQSFLFSRASFLSGANNNAIINNNFAHHEDIPESDEHFDPDDSDALIGVRQLHFDSASGGVGGGDGPDAQQSVTVGPPIKPIVDSGSARSTHHELDCTCFLCLRNPWLESSILDVSKRRLTPSNAQHYHEEDTTPIDAFVSSDSQGKHCRCVHGLYLDASFLKTYPSPEPAQLTETDAELAHRTVNAASSGHAGNDYDNDSHSERRRDKLFKGLKLFGGSEDTPTRPAEHSTNTSSSSSLQAASASNPQQKRSTSHKLPKQTSLLYELSQNPSLHTFITHLLSSTVPKVTVYDICLYLLLERSRDVDNEVRNIASVYISELYQRQFAKLSSSLVIQTDYFSTTPSPDSSFHTMNQANKPPATAAATTQQQHQQLSHYPNASSVPAGLSSKPRQTVAPNLTNNGVVGGNTNLLSPYDDTNEYLDEPLRKSLMIQSIQQQPLPYSSLIDLDYINNIQEEQRQSERRSRYLRQVDEELRLQRIGTDQYDSPIAYVDMAFDGPVSPVRRKASHSLSHASQYSSNHPLHNTLTMMACSIGDMMLAHGVHINTLTPMFASTQLSTNGSFATHGCYMDTASFGQNAGRHHSSQHGQQHFNGDVYGVMYNSSFKTQLKTLPVLPVCLNPTPLYTNNSANLNTAPLLIQSNVSNMQQSSAAAINTNLFDASFLTEPSGASSSTISSPSTSNSNVGQTASTSYSSTSSPVPLLGCTCSSIQQCEPLQWFINSEVVMLTIPPGLTTTAQGSSMPVGNNPGLLFSSPLSASGHQQQQQQHNHAHPLPGHVQQTQQPSQQQQQPQNNARRYCTCSLMCLYGAHFTNVIESIYAGDRVQIAHWPVLILSFLLHAYRTYCSSFPPLQYIDVLQVYLRQQGVCTAFPSDKPDAFQVQSLPQHLQAFQRQTYTHFSHYFRSYSPPRNTTYQPSGRLTVPLPENYITLPNQVLVPKIYVPQAVQSPLHSSLLPLSHIMLLPLQLEALYVYCVTTICGALDHCKSLYKYNDIYIDYLLSKHHNADDVSSESFSKTNENPPVSTTVSAGAPGSAPTESVSTTAANRQQPVASVASGSSLLAGTKPQQNDENKQPTANNNHDSQNASTQNEEDVPLSLGALDNSNWPVSEEITDVEEVVQQQKQQYILEFTLHYAQLRPLLGSFGPSGGNTLAYNPGDLSQRSPPSITSSYHPFRPLPSSSLSIDGSSTCSTEETSTNEAPGGGSLVEQASFIASSVSGHPATSITLLSSLANTAALQSDILERSSNLSVHNNTRLANAKPVPTTSRSPLVGQTDTASLSSLASQRHDLTATALSHYGRQSSSGSSASGSFQAVPLSSSGFASPSRLLKRATPAHAAATTAAASPNMLTTASRRSSGSVSSVGGGHFPPLPLFSTTQPGSPLIVPSAASALTIESLVPMPPVASVSLGSSSRLPGLSNAATAPAASGATALPTTSSPLLQSSSMHTPASPSLHASSRQPSASGSGEHSSPHFIPTTPPNPATSSGSTSPPNIVTTVVLPNTTVSFAPQVNGSNDGGDVEDSNNNNNDILSPLHAPAIAPAINAIIPPLSPGGRLNPAAAATSSLPSIITTALPLANDGDIVQTDGDDINQSNILWETASGHFIPTPHAGPALSLHSNHSAGILSTRSRRSIHSIHHPAAIGDAIVQLDVLDDIPLASMDALLSERSLPHRQSLAERFATEEVVIEEQLTPQLQPVLLKPSSPAGIVGQAPLRRLSYEEAHELARQRAGLPELDTPEDVAAAAAAAATAAQNPHHPTIVPVPAPRPSSQNSDTEDTIVGGDESSIPDDEDLDEIEAPSSLNGSNDSPLKVATISKLSPNMKTSSQNKQRGNTKITAFTPNRMNHGTSSLLVRGRAGTQVDGIGLLAATQPQTMASDGLDVFQLDLEQLQQPQHQSSTLDKPQSSRPRGSSMGPRS